MTSIRLEHSSSNAEKSFVSNFKIADYFFKLQVTMFSAVWWPWIVWKCSIALRGFSFVMKWTVIPIYCSYASVDWTNSQQNLAGFVDFFCQYLWMTFVDILAISVVERCFRLGLNYLIPLQKCLIEPLC